MDYHQDRFDDFSLLIFKGEELYAVLPANIKEDTVYSHQGLTYGSFVLQEKAKLLYVFEAFKTMLEFLASEGITKLDIRVIPSFYNSLPSDELEYILFKCDAKLLKRDVISLIDYGNKLKFVKSRRQAINRGAKNNLIIKVENKYDEFWNKLLIPNLSKRYGVGPVHSLEEMKSLVARFPKNIEQVNVYKDDKLVAGTTVFLTKTTIHPQYVSGDENRNSLESLDYLYDFLINDYKNDRQFFDFNVSSEDNGLVLNKGLLYWKESFGARTTVANNYLVNTDAHKGINIRIK